MPFEIPAFAGMVCGGTGNCGRILALSPPAAKLSPALSPKSPPNHNPQQTIPAKAGISQCRVSRFAIPPPILPFPPRPFLRRQESHSVVLPNTAGEGRCPLRFLPSQEWSCGGTGNCGRILALSTGEWRLLGDCAILHCEIPAFAGMVCGKTGNCGRILVLLSTGGTVNCGRILATGDN